ncbi:MAG: divalent-cation tolerance protein CutA [Candidatus Palauibacterales bacterium]|nr:divalent-cation tolerance protein CutA [Candidatus Palauibacterales bacterium]MDP2481902.1 divalent-cation tolerance protein CutA [Candidatus Palauibacterales bacterium]
MTERSVRIVFVTGPEAETLESIGRILVNEGLAACVNVIPGIRSVYRWEGRVRSDAEALAMIKTTGDRIEEARARLGELHPYEVPEFVAVEVAEGSPAYLSWVRDSVTERDG